MHLIHSAIYEYNQSLPTVDVIVDRLKLQKRVWRATASDNTEFGFELECPLLNGDVIYQSTSHRYIIEQLPEQLLEISLPSAPIDIARIAWGIGNLHFPLELHQQSIRVVDDQALRLIFSNMDIKFQETTDVFRPLTASINSHHYSR